MKKIVILGGGFAGVWSALSAMRLRKLLNKEAEIEITLINKDEYHGMRPRYYEEDLSPTQVPLKAILEPIGVNVVINEVNSIDHQRQLIVLKNSEVYHYDRLILATGSHLIEPSIPGFAEYAFNVDSYQAATKLNQHIQSLPGKSEKGRFTVIIVGSGATGIESATNIIGRLKKMATAQDNIRVIVLDRSETGSGFGEETRQVILDAFKALGVETFTHTTIKTISQDHVELDSGEIIATQTVIWAAGIQANSLTAKFGLELDRSGRLPVDQYLRIKNIKHCFAAGDVAAAIVDSKNNRSALLSCQHAIPQGRAAGNNAVADLCNVSLYPYQQQWFVTSIDLGQAGALYAEGWEQKIAVDKEKAIEIKNYVNHVRIYPPIDTTLETLIEAADPVFKAIPVS